MTWYPIGESSYGDLRGQMQYVNSERIAQQWLSLVRDFWARFGVRLSPNEAKRSRARQSLLYAAYLRNGYPVAASPFTSRHDEVFHGNAIDAGVTLADGSNRALTAAEFAWLHEQCELRGFTWTGRNFGEPWHIEGATRPEHFPPYPGITVGTAIRDADDDSNEEEDDMFTDDDRNRAKNIETMLGGLQNAISDPKRGIFARVVAILVLVEKIAKGK